MAAVETEKQHSLTRTMNQIRSTRCGAVAGSRRAGTRCAGRASCVPPRPARPLRLQAHGIERGGHEASSTGGGLRRRRHPQREQQRGGGAASAVRAAAPASSAVLAPQGGDGGDSEATALLSGLSEEEKQVLAQENQDLSERLDKEAEDVQCAAARRCPRSPQEADKRGSRTRYSTVERSMAEISSLIREMTTHAEEQDVKIRTVEDNAQDTFDNVTSVRWGPRCSSARPTLGLNA